MSTHPPTAQYWADLFGITTFEQFQAATNGALDLGLPHIPWVDTPLQKLAYYSPLSVTGAYLTAALTAEGFHEDSPSGPATVTVGSLQQLLGDQAIQENAMAGLIIPACFQVVIHAKAGTKDVINVVGVQNAAGTAHGANLAVQAAWKVSSGPMSRLFAGYVLQSFTATDISSAFGAIDVITDTTAGSVATGSFATAGACALVKWNGGVRSASSRGRLYYGPITESDVNTDGRTLVTTNQTQINTAFTNFRTSLTGAGYPLVVLSRKLLQAFPVTTSAVEATIATQRRRIRN